MAHQARVKKLGTDLGVLIPREILRELGVKEGDTIAIRRVAEPTKASNDMPKPPIPTSNRLQGYRAWDIGKALEQDCCF